MATHYSDIAAKQVDPTPTNMASCKEATPTTRILNPTYTIKGTELTGETIYLVKVQKGTTVFSTRSKVRSVGTVATAMTIDVGYYESASELDVDEFATALNVAAAGEDAFDIGVQYTFTAEGWITATIVGTLTSPNAATKLEFEIVCNTTS